MIRKLISLVLFSAFLYSMDKLPIEEREDILGKIEEFKRADNFGPSYYSSFRSWKYSIDSSSGGIEKILARFSISYPKDRKTIDETREWLWKLEKELSPKEEL